MLQVPESTSPHNAGIPIPSAVPKRRQPSLPPTLRTSCRSPSGSRRRGGRTPNRAALVGLHGPECTGEASKNPAVTFAIRFPTDTGVIQAPVIDSSNPAAPVDRLNCACLLVKVHRQPARRATVFVFNERRFFRCLGARADVRATTSRAIACPLARGQGQLRSITHSTSAVRCTMDMVTVRLANFVPGVNLT